MQAIDINTVEGREKAKRDGNSNPSRHTSKARSLISDGETIKILEEVERLLGKGQSLECINLLRALKENMQGVKNQHLQVLVVINLGILYYQVGFLEQSQEQFTVGTLKLRQLSQKTLSSRSKDMLRIKYESILGKVELQLCILYSQMGKHDLALEHAKTSSRVCYNIIFDMLGRLYSSLNRLMVSKNYQKQEKQEISVKEGSNTLNNIAVLNHLLNCTKDLKLAFAQKQRVSLLEDQLQQTRKFGFIPPKVNIQQLYTSQDRNDILWIYKNKILDEIQLVPFDVTQLEDLEPEVSNKDIIEKITYLAISLYCYSTQTRFIEKQKNCDSHDVLDSQHWLSRSLEIAYSFLPPEAPILNQIITVHDRFHGLDKQTIPEDQEVTGFFKVLKPLSKPRNNCHFKNPGCSPIMIRIQADKVDVQVDSTTKTHREPITRNTIALDQPHHTLELEEITKNNRIRNYSHGHKRTETAEGHLGKPKLSSRTTIDIPQIHNANVRTNYASKKFAGGKKKEEKLRFNMSELHGKAIISEDLLSRPRSIEDSATVNQIGPLRVLTDRRKRSLPTRKSDPHRKPLLHSNPIKFQGLELKGHRMEETIDSDFLDRIQNQTKVMEATRVGGNVYINNNINLYISRQAEPFGQTFVRGQVAPDKKEADKESSRRQLFLNKRRANNYIAHEDM